jgi:phenylacetate-CoA ligase
MTIEDRLYPLLAAYDRLPRPVKTAIGWSYRQFPTSWRLGSHYREFCELAEGCESWSATELRDYQLARLREVLTHAAAHCPYYAQRFKEARFFPGKLESLEDLERCPPLHKQDILIHRDDMASRAVPSAQRLYITTGGSTGVPVGFYLQRGVSRPKEQAFLEAQWRRGGYFPGARLAVIRGYTTTSRASGRIASYDATRDWLMLSSSHLTTDRMPEYLDTIEKFKPDLLHAYPSAALQIAEFLEKHGQTWRVPLRGLLAGSERLTRPARRLLERVFRCRIYTWYGHSERTVLAGEGRQSQALYFWPTYGLVEFGPADPNGFREVIGTSFHNLAMPLIRYHTGDYVRLMSDDATRELPWPAAEAIEGREQEFLVTTTGRRISMTAINMHDSIFDDLYSVQFYQDEAGRAELRYVPRPTFARSRVEHIREGVRRKLGDDFQLEVREVSDTEKTARGKHRWLISKLDEAQVAAELRQPVVESVQERL